MSHPVRVLVAGVGKLALPSYCISAVAEDTLQDNNHRGRVEQAGKSVR